MKDLLKLISILSLIFVFGSCSNAPESMGSNESDTGEVLDLENLALTHLKSNFDDIAAAEYQGMDVLDTMFNTEFVERELIIYNRALENKVVRLTNANTAIEVARLALEADPNDVKAQKAQNSAMNQKANIESSQRIVDSLNTLAIEGVKYYEVLLKYTRVNEEGKSEQENYGIKVGPNGTVQSAAKTRRTGKK